MTQSKGMNLTVFVAMIVSSVLFINCGRPSRLPETSGLSDVGASGEVSFKMLADAVFIPKCAGCHANFSTYASLMASGAVIPGSPDQSALYQKISTGQMPKTGGPLSDPEVQSIYAWINAGAPELASTAGNPATGGGGAPLSPPPGSGPAPLPGSISPTFAWIKSNVFTPRCVLCHSGSGAPAGYDLSTFAGVKSGGRIVAGNPGTSILIQRISNGSMPPGGPALSPDVVAAISKWIENGALDDGTVADRAPQLPSPQLPPLEPKFASIMANIIAPRCLACHSTVSPAKGVDLQTYTGVREEVRPGSASNSKFYEVIEKNEMPKSGGALTATQKETIRSWIESGAADN
jgi:mono/diheme cytochrome c family protein